MNYQNYIFDLDGTIVNSSEEVLVCFEKAFKKADYKIDKNRLTSDVIGPPLAQIIQSIAPELDNENKINEIISNFRSFYDYDEKDISVMYDGIYDLLFDLKQQGCNLFIATFKPTIPTMRLIDKFNLKEIFQDIYTIDKFGKKISKEEMISNIISTYGLEKSKTVMIGDASTDMIASKACGVFGIGALWGYGSNKDSLKVNADCVVKDVKELRVCLKLNYQTI